MTIVSLYESLMEDKTKKKKVKSESQWTRDTIEDLKKQVERLDDEIVGVLKLNAYCSVEHCTHVLVRNHIKRERIPDEVWQCWVDYVREKRKVMIYGE